MRVSAPIARSTRRQLSAAATLILAGFGIAACDLNPNVEACSVTIAPTNITVTVNGRQPVVGTAFDCKGNSIRDKRISFSTTNPAIATVSDDGNVIGISVGSTTISAVANGKSGTAQVTVTPEAAVSVQVSPATVTLREGNTRDFTATAKNAVGTNIPGRTFRWTSSNSSVASVDQNGRVIALRTGNVQISAEADNVLGNAAVSITALPIGNCALSPATQRVTVSQQAQPTVTLRDTANNIIPALNRPIAWTSDNEVVATVSNTGVVSSRRAGSARITATPTEYPNVSCQATVEVVDARIVTAQITPRVGSLRLGIPRQLTATLFDSLGGIIGPGRIVSWTSATPAIASVSATGLVSATALGTARIAIRAEGAVDTVAFSVTRVPVAVVRLSPLSSSVLQGQPVTLTATVEDSTGVTVTDRVIEWNSSDPARATVSNIGVVSTTAPGNVTITATSESRQGTATVNIQPIPVDTIVANDYTVNIAAATKAFQITLRDVNGNQVFNRNVSITSSSPSVATGQANALATQVNVNTTIAGTTTFTIRALNANGQPEGKATTITVTVTPLVP
ncbi:MAG TPA: Ig-like domain-containing protein [Gemmatimonas sp.]|nr:Ig-like domain-containing protein [Gemmatimonas sp.]